MILSQHVTFIADKNVRVTVDNRAQTDGFDGRQLEVLIVNHWTLDSWTWRVYEIIKAVSDRTHWRMIKDFTSSVIPCSQEFPKTEIIAACSIFRGRFTNSTGTNTRGTSYQLVYVPNYGLFLKLQNLFRGPVRSYDNSNLKECIDKFVILGWEVKKYRFKEKDMVITVQRMSLNVRLMTFSTIDVSTLIEICEYEKLMKKQSTKQV